MQVPISTQNFFKGSKEQWFEQVGKSYRLKSDLKLLHISYCGKLKGFEVGVQTCFYSEEYSKLFTDRLTTKLHKRSDTMGGYNEYHYYSVTIPAGTLVTEVGNNEIRATVNMKFSAEYIGKVLSYRIWEAGKGGVDYYTIKN